MKFYYLVFVNNHNSTRMADILHPSQTKIPQTKSKSVHSAAQVKARAAKAAHPVSILPSKGLAGQPYPSERPALPGYGVPYHQGIVTRVG
jgi:hypothetical protein